MTLLFNKPLTINSDNWKTAPFRFYGEKEPFMLGNGKVEPTWQDIIVSGTNYVNLPNAKANSLNYLKLYGKSIQTLLPEGYTQLDYIANDSNAYINTNILINTTTSRYETMIVPTGKVSNMPVFGTRTSTAAATSSANIFITSTKFRLDWLYARNDSSLPAPTCSVDTSYEINITRGSAIINNTSYTDSESTSVDISYPFYIFSFNNVGTVYTSSNKTFLGRVYYARLYNNDNLVFNGIPAKRNLDGICGLYDTVTNTFFTSSNSTNFTGGNAINATPTYTNPVPLSCNNGLLKVTNGSLVIDGTTETVNVHGKNLFNVTWEQGAIGGNAGNTYNELKTANSSRIRIKDEIYLDPKKTYTISLNDTADDLEYAIYLFNEQDVLYKPSGSSEWRETSYSFTGAYGCAIALRYKNAADILPSAGALSKIQLEVSSTATTYEPYYNGGTATAENLFGIGNTSDIQDVLTGAITRNYAVKIFNGTESCTWDASFSRIRYANFFSNEIPDGGTRNVSMLCTHFPCIDDSREIAAVPAFTVYANLVDRYLFFKLTSPLSGVNNWQSWLRTQYENGNPVILIYPLRESTTETVTAQTLNIKQGNNTIEITQASINDLTLEASYKAGVIITITEVQNANIDNQVTVVIGD